MRKQLRIAINAQIIPGTGAGGIETVVRFLTSVGRLGGNEEYVFIGHPDDESDWLKPFLHERQTWIRAPRFGSAQKTSGPESFKRLLGPLRPLARGVKSLLIEPPKPQPVVSVSDGFYESLECDVIHFPYQDFVQTGFPSIYNPHDLQHLHFPQYFSAGEFRRRETVYPTACRSAHTVVTASKFVKQDIVDNYGINPDKIKVITWGPPEMEPSEFTNTHVQTVREKYRCPPEPFVLYPAMTWEHKNHIRLLESIAVLRDRDRLKVNLVCTGHKNSFYPKIENRRSELGLEGQVMFTGVVEHGELSVLYRMAQSVIIPTLFEAASAPLLEAWQHGVPVACSSVTSLPEQAGDAALLFDPFSVEEIAAALKVMSADPVLRGEFRARGRERLMSFDSDRTARSYRAVYRRAAGVDLNDDDRELLNEVHAIPV